MQHVSTHYRIYLGAAHSRRPRHTQPWVEPDASSEVDVASGGVYTPYAPPTLAYASSTGPAEPRFLFWSVNDGVVGRMQPTRSLTVTVTEHPLTLIAWYYHPGGGGPGTPDGGPNVLIDGYSVSRGDFFNEDFVTVTSDPSLSASANTTGRVPTTTAQTIQAFGQYSPTSSVSTRGSHRRARRRRRSATCSRPPRDQAVSPSRSTCVMPSRCRRWKGTSPRATRSCMA